MRSGCRGAVCESDVWVAACPTSVDVLGPFPFCVILFTVHVEMRNEN